MHAIPSRMPLSVTASLTSSVMSRTARPPAVRNSVCRWKTFTGPYSEDSGGQRNPEPSFPGSAITRAENSAALLALATAVHARASESCQLQGCQGRCGHPRTGVWAPLTPIGQCAFLERNDRKGDGSLFCGLRRKTVLIVCLFAVLFAAGVALASVGKFSRITSSATFSTSTTAAATSSGAASAAALSGATATSTTLSAVLTVNFTESGLGNVGDSDVVTATATTINTTYFCVNGGGNNPKASNKITIPGPPASASRRRRVFRSAPAAVRRRPQALASARRVAPSWRRPRPHRSVASS